ncbi:MAG: hypothetical protein NVSMB38_45570 [Ktedonobacteraceae bacterium]
MVHQVAAHHLRRLACLYVRQSTLHQVFENTESTARQYALRERALALGWAEEHILVIDQDLGHSAASTTDRLGFQRLVASVGLGQVGLVLGLEVSRLARNSNKARRGALKLTLPIGLCYTEADAIVLDPDLQVQTSIREVFRSFQHTGSAFATVRHFHQHHLLFPRRIRCGPHQGEIVWGEMQHHDVLRVLHQPAYAGAYVFGRTRTTKSAEGKVHSQEVPRLDWDTLVKNAHVGYISLRGV